MNARARTQPRRRGLLWIVILLVGALTACEGAAVEESQSADVSPGDGSTSVGLEAPCETAKDCVSQAASGGCEVATCEAETSTCKVLPAPNGTPCAASDATCGAAGACEAGLCVASPSAGDECDDANPCTVDVCAPGTGCTHFSIPDGSTCDDERTCTYSDVCTAGACQGVEQSPDCKEPECGDETCDADEDAQLCPEDCVSETGAVCGDGDCAEEESTETCPDDCISVESECGNGLCEGAELFFCPQDCQ